MAYLVDTSVLLTIANKSDIQYELTQRAIMALHRRGDGLHIVPQNLIEFRSAASRPAKENGLDFSPTDIEQKTATFEELFVLLPETEEIFPAWKSLVQAAEIIGKQVDDAPLVATCHVFWLSHVLLLK